jgi:hypothetical protein
LNLRQQTRLVTMFHTTRQSCWGFPIPPSSPATRVYQVAGLSIIKEDKGIGGKIRSRQGVTSLAKLHQGVGMLNTIATIVLGVTHHREIRFLRLAASPY